MKTLALLLAVAILLVILDRVALWMESRGWIYYRRRKPSASALGNAFLEVQSLVEPGQRRVLEARQDDHTEHEEAGDPPDPGAHGERDPGSPGDDR